MKNSVAHRGKFDFFIFFEGDRDRFGDE